MLLLNHAYCKEVWLKGDFECYGVQMLNVRSDVCIAFGVTLGQLQALSFLSNR